VGIEQEWEQKTLDKKGREPLVAFLLFFFSAVFAKSLMDGWDGHR